jgi:metal-responsive CopG/Arc/MetJ family transcriptional regulator
MLELRRQCITVSLDSNVLAQLNDYCKRVGINRSRAIEEFIENAMNDSHTNVGKKE